VGTLPLDLFLAIVGAQTEIAMVPMLEIRDTLF